MDAAAEGRLQRAMRSLPAATATQIADAANIDVSTVRQWLADHADTGDVIETFRIRSDT